MNSEEKYLFEKNDLSLLHAWFEKGSTNQIAKEDMTYPSIQMEKITDVWSEVIDIISNSRTDKYRSIYFEIEKTNISQDGKLWWMSLLAVAMNAPLNELENFSRGAKQMPDVVSTESIRVAARILVDYVAEVERIKREKERIEKEMRMKELKKEAEEKQRQKDQAEANLQRHRNQGSQ